MEKKKAQFSGSWEGRWTGTGLSGWLQNWPFVSHIEGTRANLWGVNVLTFSPWPIYILFFLTLTHIYFLRNVCRQGLDKIRWKINIRETDGGNNKETDRLLCTTPRSKIFYLPETQTSLQVEYWLLDRASWL